MIQLKVILCELKALHISDEELIERSERSVKIRSIRCPHCGCKGCFQRIAPYSRMMISMEKGKRRETLIKIPRVKCIFCGRTQGLLANSLIPFSSYSLRFILQTLLDYLNRSNSVTNFCESRAISISTLYSWIHLFQKQYHLWSGTVRSIYRISQTAISDIQSIPAFPTIFYERFSYCFLQTSTSLYKKSLIVHSLD